jgi:hypothetical protein
VTSSTIVVHGVVLSGHTHRVTNFLIERVEALPGAVPMPVTPVPEPALP